MASRFLHVMLGAARQGDGKAPHFVGGGAVFPPQPVRARSYCQGMPAICAAPLICVCSLFLALIRLRLSA